jgi:glycosyltransferase involved in cell wall biosynthesis
MKIYLCTTATSKKYKSWSNIPYLLHKNFEKKNYKVKNFVLREFLPIKFLFNLPVRLLIKFFNLKTTYYYVRTPLHFFFTYLYSQYIRFVSKDDDVMVVQGFSYPPHNNKNKMLILGDWPSSYLFDNFLKRKPSKMEMKSIAREDRVIESANAVITLFPNVHEYMLKRYQNKNIYYFGNVVNIDAEVVIPLDILAIKKNSKNLLFIGKPFYLDGANKLISAVENLRAQGYELNVDIVGIESSLISKKFDWLTIHGYLDKGKPSDKHKYYALLEGAKLFINTTPSWNAFQATLEAMYFYTPIVSRSNESLVQTFPELEGFSYIVEERNKDLEKEIIKSLECKEQYLEKCENSHKAVKPYTWENFTQKLVGLFE